MRRSPKPSSGFRDRGSAGRHRAFANLIVLVAPVIAALSLLPGPARAEQAQVATSPFVQRSEADVLLLAVRLDEEILTEALTAYADGGELLVPFGQLCDLLGLAITTDVAHGTAAGFFISEGRLFDLDVATGAATVEGKPSRFDAAGVEIHQDDLYIRASLISEWFPLRLDVDLYGAVIVVRPRDRLPIQLRLDRERKLASSLAGRARTEAKFPVQALPYRLLDGPFVDQSVRFLRVPNAAGGGTNSLQYSTNVTGDLLFAEANAFLSGTEQGISDTRLSLSRKDPDGQLLGFLDARDVTVGDVLHPGLDLVASARSGPGFLVSNYPLQAPTQFDRQSFRGSLPAGWDVELYRNDELLAYGRSRPDGLYEFLDVALLFGMNIFRLEFYGPQGQKRRETSLLNVGQSQTPPGELRYRLVGNDPSLRLVGTGPANAGRRASLETSVGLARNVSATLAVASVDLSDGRHEYAKAGLRGFWSWLFANADFAADRRGGSVLQATLQSRVRAFGFFLQHAEIRDFRSEVFSDAAGALERRTTLRLDSAIPETFLPRLPISLELRQDRLVGGQLTNRFVGRISAFRRATFLSNQVTWSFSPGAETTFRETAQGQLLASQLIGRFALRGEMAYDLRPTQAVTTLALTAERGLGTSYLATGGITRLLREGRTTYSVGLNKLEGAFGFGVSVDYVSPDGFGVNALVSISFGRDPRRGKWHSRARTMAPLGALSGRAFLDTNGNGVRDAGEKPVPGAGILLNGSNAPGVTDAGGDLFVSNLPPHRHLDVSLATATLEDPYWKPGVEGTGIVPRPGKTALVDFPVIVSGEITGTVYVARGGVRGAATNVELELVDATGSVLKKTRSAYDGFYELTDLRPGRYALRVAASSLTRLGVETGPAPRPVEMSPTGTVLEVFDFVLERAPEPATLPGVAALPDSAPRVAPPAPPAAVPPPSVPSAPGSGRASTVAVPEGTGPEPIYGVHLSSYRERLKAEGDARIVGAQLGIPTHVSAFDLGPKGVWYRVLVGELRSPAEGLALQETLRRKGLPSVGPVYRVEPTGVQAPTSQPSPARTAPVVRRGTFGVQVSSHRDRDKAEAESRRISARLGLPSRVIEVPLGAKGTWYRVIVGDLETAVEASALVERLEKDGVPVGPIQRIGPKR